MKLIGRVLRVAPLVVAWAMSCAAANAQSSPSVAAGVVRDKMFEQMVQTCYPAPDQLELYGAPGWKLGTPFPTPMDNYYSGAKSRPCDLDHWYGNGYNW